MLVAPMHYGARASGRAPLGIATSTDKMAVALYDWICGDARPSK